MQVPLPLAWLSYTHASFQFLIVFQAVPVQAFPSKPQALSLFLSYVFLAAPAPALRSQFQMSSNFQFFFSQAVTSPVSLEIPFLLYN